MNDSSLTGALFITATGTEVGKTVVSCLIADQFVRRERDRASGAGHQKETKSAVRVPVGLLKPIATGVPTERARSANDGLALSDANTPQSDAAQLAAAAGIPEALHRLVNPISFEPPVTPSEALRRLGQRRIDLAPVFKSIEEWRSHTDTLLIEGLGGVLAPLGYETERAGARLLTVLDLIDMLGCPALIVADARLGTLNHTALTVTALQSRDIPIAGVVLNRVPQAHETPDESISSNAHWIEAQCGVPVPASIPDLAALSPAARWNPREIHPALRAAIDLTDFRTCLGALRPRAAQ